LALPVIAAAGLVIGTTFLPPATSQGSPSIDPSGTISAVAPSTATDPTPDVASGSPSSTAATPAPDLDASAASGAVGTSAMTAASQPTALNFPAAAIDMEILSLTLSDAELESQQLVPPLTLNAYWLTPYGFPGSDSEDTTYIVGHSWDGEDAPFNRLSDEALTGTEFTLTTASGDIAYVVDSVITHDKDTLKDSDIWDIVPHRVVLISCYTEDPWGKNVVITASPKTA
jgi:hypothetical protein